MVERSDHRWSTGEGDGKSLQYSYVENPMNSMKRQKDRILKDELPRSVGAKYATGDQWRDNSRKNEGMQPKQKQHPVVDGTGDRSKVRCCKEQYCIGTWNVRLLNQGKSEVVKQEMARVNIDILGISELRWTGKGEFNSDDHFVCYCGQESLRRNGVAIMVNKRVRNAVLPPLGHSSAAVLEVEAAWTYKGLQCACMGLRDGVGWAGLEIKLHG